MSEVGDDNNSHNYCNYGCNEVDCRVKWSSSGCWTPSEEGLNLSNETGDDADDDYEGEWY